MSDDARLAAALSALSEVEGRLAAARADGVPRQRLERTYKARRKRLRAAHQAGLSYAELGELVGTSASSVRRQVHPGARARKRLSDQRRRARRNALIDLHAALVALLAARQEHER